MEKNSIGPDAEKARKLAEDEGTNTRMSDHIRQQEKLVWMYSSYLDR